MTFEVLMKLWEIAKLVFPGQSISSIKNRMIFIWTAYSNLDLVLPFLNPDKDSPIEKLMMERPETLGAVLWPYQCHSWKIAERLNRIKGHYDALIAHDMRIDFSVNDAIRLFKLDDIYPDLHIVLDQPIWFIREGQLVINLFVKNTRIFSLAFSLYDEPSGLTAYIGAMQGRNIEGLLDTYRDITKALHGMRPRDFLFELFRFFCLNSGIVKIYAVSDAKKHHRSPYFGKSKIEEVSLNYDEIWEERGGVKSNNDFYTFSVKHENKPLEEIASKKRSMYRKRYELLDQLSNEMKLTYEDIDNPHRLEIGFKSL